MLIRVSAQQHMKPTKIMDQSVLAEWQSGVGKCCQHLVFLTFGTGMAT